LRKSHDPFWYNKLKRRLNAWYVRRFIAPQFDQLGDGLAVLKPHTLQLFGAHISAGRHLHIISSREHPVKLNTWSSKQSQGKICIGDHVLISPGAQISSALQLDIGNNCMLAAESYLSDCDWHGVYNRTRPFRCSEKLVLENNVWVGYRAIIGKGVHIGENSIVAAGSVVVHDVPKNTIVGGNPAVVIKRIEPARRMLTREFLFQGEKDYQQEQALIEEYLNANNTTIDWLRTKLKPNHHD
jgi:acetyltransferase-like isoleucine patch superfamily enzyme